jgi:sodium-dependent dicarboxylate transporter 2/3/5
MALPIVIVMFVAVPVICILFNRPEVSEVDGVEEYVSEERRKLGSLSRGEKNTLIVLAFALVGWFPPGLVGIVAGDASDAYTQVEEASNEGIVAILAAALLFVLPIDWARRKFTLNWNQASQIDWGTVLLFGGGLVLGSLLSETGLAEVVGTSISDALGVSSIVGITIVIVIVAVLISETTSNTASAAIVVPIAIAIAGSAGVNPTIPALAAIFGANYGFMLPVSTPPNAIVYSSGMLPITRMIRAGVVFDIIGAVLCVIGVIAMANLVGLA